MKLPTFKAKWNNCTLCDLHKKRSRVVHGMGNPSADLFLLGEAPGKNEDAGGEPFIGRAGKLLDKILAAINLKREEIWISNTCLCRPPQNRNPKSEEIAACFPRLSEEIDIISPKVLVVMGNIPLGAVAGLSGIGRWRGWVASNLHPAVYCTYHPAAMLYDPGKKPAAWEDWKAIRDKINDGR